MNCNKCSAALDDGATRCDKCGALQSEISRGAITYDYKTVETSRYAAAEVVDCYENLGWELSNNGGGSLPGATLNFKRNRKVKNKDQLNRIQVRMDDAIESIKIFEKGKTKRAITAAIIMGIIGALMFGGGMSICMLLPLVSDFVSYAAGCILGAGGLGICGLGYLAYVKIRAKKTAEMNILIDKKRDDIAGLCEEAGRLLSK